jgi:hypothetical protein
MEIIVFAGPSIVGTDARDWPRISFRPPAECGDLARAVMARPRAIGLIDGCFETCASPWHKEILWGLSKDIPIFGAASMGALRAVELQPYGMVGIGTVFDAYRRGHIDGDDEVAVLHGPPDVGYLPLTEAMVNIRASLTKAREAGVIRATEERALLLRAKSLFYKERTWKQILDHSFGGRIPRSRLGALAQWLPGNVVNVKFHDACELLEKISKRMRHVRRRAPPRFVNTEYFEELLRRL